MRKPRASHEHRSRPRPVLLVRSEGQAVAVDLREALREQRHKKGVSAIFGKWPGNETDEQIAEAQGAWVSGRAKTHDHSCLRNTELRSKTDLITWENRTCP